MKVFAVAVIFWCLLISQTVLGLDEESVKEKQHCLRNPPSPLAKIVNLKWTQSAKWYFSHFSKLELYRLASEVKNTPISEIQEDEMYKDACLIMKWGDGGVSPLVEFNGKTTLFNLTPVDKTWTVFTFKAPYSKSDGTAYVTLTDNKTFIFFSTCWGDDEASWGVISNTKTLSEKTIKKILTHAKSLGFDEKHFASISYEFCKDEDFVDRDEL